MSVYPRPSSTNNSFNPNDIITSDDSGGNGSVVLQLGNYVQKDNPVFSSDVYMSAGGKLNFQGELQSSPYTEANKASVLQSEAKLEHVTVDGLETRFSNNVNLSTATVQLADDQIAQTKITGLTARLTGIDTNLSEIVLNDSEILSNKNNITLHETRLDAADLLFAEHGINLLEIETDIASVVKPSITAIETRASALEAADGLIHSRLDVNETLLASHATSLLAQSSDISATETATALNASNLNDYEVSNDAALAGSNANISQNITDISSLDARVLIEEAKTVEQDALIIAANAKNDAQDLSITAIELENADQQSEIDAAAVTLANHTAILNSHSGSLTTNGSDIAVLQTTSAQHTADIGSNTTAISTKQSTISSSNRLPASFVGNGDVSAAKLSMLNSLITTNPPLQSQLDTLNASVVNLDALQDIDITSLETLTASHTSSISAINSSLNTADIDITAIENRAMSLEALTTSQSTSITALLASDTTHDGQIAANSASISTNSGSITALVGADVIHSTEISALQTADGVLQANINLKQNIISLSNQLEASKIFDTTLNDSLDNILSVLDSNISTLSSSKQDALSGINKLNSLYIDLSTTSLGYVDITSPLAAQLTALSDAIILLQGDDATDLTTFQTISDNFTSLNATVTSIQSSISTLQGLQDGDIVSFAAINSSLTNLTNTKHPLIDTNNKLASSLLTRDDNMQYVDVSSSISTSLSGLQAGIDTKQAILSGANKLPIANVDLGVSALSHVDIGSSLATTLTGINSSIGTLSAADVSQATINAATTTSLNAHTTSIASNVTDIASNSTAIASNVTNIASNSTAIATNATDIASNVTSIATNATDIASNVTSIATNATDIASNVTSIATNATDIASNVTSIATNATDIASNVTDIASNSTAIATNSTDIALKLNSTDYQPKIDTVSSGTFAANSLAYSFDESTIYMNQLTESTPFELDLTITTPENNKTYIQKIIAECLEFKAYANTLKINTETVEIKYLDGDGAINLAPIAGYSNILQTLELTRINNAWFCLSKLQLFFNSASNTVYDVTDPIITLVGSAVVNVEINSGAYSDAGATANDNVAGDLTNSIVVSGDTVDHTVLGVYNIYYDVDDTVGNSAIQKTRTVNVIDTTNPVVVLTGSSELTIDQNSVWSELGYSASDNSNESLTVVVSGDIVDTAVIGDYTIVYTATDSSSNVHAVSRLIHVVGDGFTLEWSNPSVDIIEGLIGLYNYTLVFPANETVHVNTIASHPSPFVAGTYTFTDNWKHEGLSAYDMRELWHNSGMWVQQGTTSVTTYNDPVFGSITTPFDRPPYVDGLAYQGNTSTNSVFVFYTHPCSNATTYNGCFHQIEFPFYIAPLTIKIHWYANRNLDTVILASNDSGTTWDYLGEHNEIADAVFNTIDITSATRYNMIKIVYTKGHWANINNISTKQIQLYGDIYSSV